MKAVNESLITFHKTRVFTRKDERANESFVAVLINGDSLLKKLFVLINYP